MPDIEPKLRSHEFFAGFSDEHIARVAGLAADAFFAEGHTIFHEGQPAETFFAIYEGDVALELVVPGRGPRMVMSAHPGDVIGWAWLVPPHRRVFDARALTPVRAIEINGAELRAAISEDHEFGYHLMHRFSEVMASRLQATRLQLLDLYGTRS